MSKGFYKMIIGIVKPVSKLMARNKVVGLDNIPKTGGVIVAPNHISHIDPIFIGTAIAPRRQLKALAKESLFKNSIIGFALTKMGHIPVKRNSATASDSLKEAVKRIKAGEAVAIYPEGTIPINLETLGAFKHGASRLALLTGAPIIPVAQWGAQYSFPRHATTKNIFESLRKRPKNTIVIGEPLEHELLNKEPQDEVDSSDVVEVTIALAEKLEEMVAPMRNKEKLKQIQMDNELKELVGKEIFEKGAF